MLACKLLAQCLLAASLQNQVPPEALLAIMEVEGGRPGIEVRNENGTYDLGLMQVNSLWIPEVSRLWHISKEKARTRLREDNCFNITVAAYILKTKIKEGGGNLLQGIARYHHAHPRYGHPYREKVLRVYYKQEQKRKKRHGPLP